MLFFVVISTYITHLPNLNDCCFFSSYAPDFPVWDLLARTKDERLLHFGVYSRGHKSFWHKGRVVIMGDAAHATVCMCVCMSVSSVGMNVCPHLYAYHAQIYTCIRIHTTSQSTFFNVKSCPVAAPWARCEHGHRGRCGVDPMSGRARQGFQGCRNCPSRVLPPAQGSHQAYRQFLLVSSTKS